VMGRRSPIDAAPFAPTRMLGAPTGAVH
jgi:hypothetical protein